MITRKQVHQAIDDGLIDLIKARAANGATVLLSDTDLNVAQHFRDGLIKIKAAAEDQHGVVDEIFPDGGDV